MSHAHGQALPEMTLRGIVLGALITVVFTASNVYLGLKVGLTFASSIPAAVISMAVLRYCRNANILENNMVQTQASAAGTLSAIIFVLPGLLMIGFWAGFPFWQAFSICAIGGILGVLYTIPLRRVMVVQSSLPYPEGVAAAEILKVGERPAQDDGGKRQGTGAGDIVLGGVAAAVFTLLASGFRVLADGISLWFSAGRAAFQLSTGFSLALVGAGYLVGIVGGMALLTGLLIAWGVAVPWLTLTHAQAPGQSLSELGMALWSSDVRFMGAGTIAIAALWTLGTLSKALFEGLKHALAASARPDRSTIERTDRDLPGVWILGLAGVLLIALVAVFAVFLQDNAPGLSSLAFWSLVIGCVLFAFVFGFLIAAACGYMAGLVGSSSSPISGIGIIAVILVSLLILALSGVSTDIAGAAGGQLAVGLALFTTSVILAIAAISNDNLQDLKTGYLVGATPWRQQLVLIIGCVVGALIIPPVLTLLYNAYGFTGALPREGMDPAQALAAPQATLMSQIASGIFNHDLNTHMLLIGVALGAVLIGVDELLRRRGGTARLPVLAVGLGIYLPPSVNMPLVIGALLSWFVARRLARREAATREHAQQRGVLLASGLIVGESLMGVLMAGVIGFTGSEAPLALVGSDFADTAQWLGLIVFAAACMAFYQRITATRA
ncbi:OPT family oligopeptide transporter [Kushneria konosiri]|uniref:Oligopeptide transporter, OPT family n=1 Tax=Kushneria konosiri TaxID=698828 RepID=A0A2Z2H5N8_9GAMM|nr:oligopeptide transporter, OPT family [Kushneria konosiri]ARS52693.1 oligopeptide transporter, OPT family [Kushneria konosiri]